MKTSNLFKQFLPSDSTPVRSWGLVLLFLLFGTITVSAQEAYACYTTSNTTLTFYYDNQRSSRSGTTYALTASDEPGWFTDGSNTNVTKVVFKSSFANARPKTTRSWFEGMYRLQSITGISYLNTSEVTNMGSMFEECKSLSSLDVSNFDTRNVTNMALMFYGCSKLKTLNLSNFNTAKVTNMSWMFKDCKGLTSLDLSGFNTSKVNGMARMFEECNSLTSLNVSNFNTAKVTIMYFMFCGCNVLKALDVSSFNTANVTDMTSMFYGCSELKALDVSSFNTANVTDMSSMFGGCSSLTSLNVSNFDTNKIKRMRSMFSGCSGLTALDVSNFNTANVTDMSYMFYKCDYLTSLDLINFNTAKVTDMSYMFSSDLRLKNLNLCSFNTANVTNMFAMFQNCQTLTSLDLSYFNTANVTNMRGMFFHCYKLTTIYASTDWSTAAVTSSGDMFNNCTKLVGGQGTTYNENHVDAAYAHIDGGTSNPGYLTAKYNEPEVYANYVPSNTTLTFYYDNRRLSRTGTTYDLNKGTNYPGWKNDGTNAKVTTVVFDPKFTDVRPTTTASWFYDMQNLQSITGISYLNTTEVTNMSTMFFNCSKLTSLDLSSFNTAKVTAMNSMFSGCSGLTSLNLSGFNTAKVTNMSNMFNKCSSLTSLNVSGFNTANVTNMSNMFNSCSNLTSLNPRNFNTAKVTNMSYMFSGCNELTSLNVSGFNTSQVTTMNSMFQSCFKLTQCDVSGFNTANVTNMQSMFSFCRLLPSIDVSNFNTAKVTTMYAMFQGCNVVTTLDLSSFNTAKVTNMKYMFDECRALKTIMVSSGWTTAAVTSSEDMFATCTNLVGGQGTTYNANHRDKEYAHIDGGTSNPGYLTDKGSPYTVLSADGKTLTFYADGKRLLRTEKTYPLNQPGKSPDWKTDANGAHYITTVVFDASFASARPVSTCSWFAYSSQLTTITNLEYLNTSEVTDMSQMFSSCSKLTSLDLHTFNTVKVTDMYGMFQGSNALTTIDLSSFSTAGVTDMRYMFKNCSALTTVCVGNGWDASHAQTDDMFYHCYNIVGEVGTTYNSAYDEHVGEDAAHIDTEDYPGYFVSADYLTVPYALLTSDGKKLTFYHDGLRATRRTSKTYSINWAYNDEPAWYNDESCLEITNVVFDSSFANARPTSTYYWFGQMNKLTGITGLKYLDTSEVNDMSFMFEDCIALTSLDVSHFDTKNVTYMRAMFSGCSELKSLDVSHFDTKNVTDMASMFSYCNNLTALDVSGFDTRKVTDMGGMFSNCQRLTSIDVSNFKTTSTTNLGDMFYCCKALTSLDLSSFNTAKVTDMNWMFHTCTNLQTIYVSKGWNTDNVTQSGNMFKDCAKLVGGQGTTYDASHVDKAYARIDGGTSKPGYLTDAYGPYAALSQDNKTLTFYNDGQRLTRSEKTYSLNQGSTLPAWYSDGSYANVTKVVFDVSFADLWPTSTYAWFTQMAKLTEITGISNLDTRDVTTMRSMFNGCSSLTSIDLSYFKTENVTSMRQMFLNCSILTSIDLSTFNTAKVTEMYYMFGGCSSLTNLDVSSFNTESVTDMGYMFSYCSSLTNLDLSGFDTKNVTNMGFMFFKSSHLTSIDLSSFNTASVTAMDRMFSGCTSLTTVYAGDSWSTAAVKESDYMFNNCINIKGGQGTTYDANHIDKAYAHIDGGPSNPGYLTYKGAFLLGDVNHDGSVDISDVLATVDYILGKPLTVFFLSEADINADKEINISDVLCIVDIILGKSTYSAPANARMAVLDDLSLLRKDNTYTLCLDNHEPYSGFQLRLSLPDGCTLRNASLMADRSDGHRVSVRNHGDGTYTLIAYSPEGRQLRDNGTPLLRLTVNGSHAPEDIQLTGILFSTPQRETVILSDVNGTVTDIMDIVSDQNDNTAPAYNMQGQRVSPNYRGLVIKNGEKRVVK